MLEHTVEGDVRGMALSAYLRRAYPAIPAYALREALKKKDVRVNGERAGADAPVRGGDRLRIYIDTKYTDNSLCVLYEGAGLLVVEKPQGLPVDADGKGVGADTVLTRARAKYPEAELCHRLDAGTGGVLLLAYTAETLEAVLRAFKEETVRKTYLTAVAGVPERLEGSLSGSILKDADGARVRVVAQGTPGARSARTDYRVLDTASVRGQTVSLVEARIHTGRTHQIRAHMANAGMPVIGDDKYGDRELNAILHAKLPSLWCAEMVPEGEGLPEEVRGRAFASTPKFPLWKEFAAGGKGK